MPTAWSYWTRDLAEKLSHAAQSEIKAEEIVVPPDASLGDLSFPCFRLAKVAKIDPAKFAQQLVQTLSAGIAGFSEIKAVGPYVNFTLTIGDAVHRVVRDVETADGRYGASEQPVSGQVLFEYANPNTHKEIHIGHLRMISLGVSLSRVMQAYGLDLVPVSYINDVGSNVSKTLWFLVSSKVKDIKQLTLAEAETVIKSVKAEDRHGSFLGAIYTDATKFTDEHPEAKTEIAFVQQQLEAHDQAWEYLWRETRRWSLEEIHDIFSELGVKVKRQYYESDMLDRSHEIVAELLEKKIARESEGAIIVDLEAQGLGAFLIRKSDGTLLYAAKDLALAELKRKEYPQHIENLMLVDSRQSLYFKQLFETLKRLEFTQRFEQIGFEIVTLPEGTMSSRKGNVVTYESFRDTVIEYARKEIIERHPEWPDGKVRETSWNIALGGIKFAMLKQDSDKKIVFNLQQALSFEGATGPYCQYAATRLGSILKKAPKKIDLNGELTRGFDHLSEKRLALALAQFPAALSRAAKEHQPALIAQWCFELAQRINEFYRDVPVLESTGELLQGRLRLSEASKIAMKNGLELLGITLPDEM